MAVDAGMTVASDEALETTWAGGTVPAHGPPRPASPRPKAATIVAAGHTPPSPRALNEPARRCAPPDY